MSTTKEKIAVMQAAEEGKTIQIRFGNKKEWVDLYTTPGWDWVRCEYRVKPENEKANHGAK